MRHLIRNYFLQARELMFDAVASYDRN